MEKQTHQQRGVICGIVIVLFDTQDLRTVEGIVLVPLAFELPESKLEHELDDDHSLKRQVILYQP